RVYDNNGKHIAKGHVVNTTDSSLFLRVKKDTVQLFLNDFGSIKTKRSAGNNVIIGTFAVSGLFAIIGAASSDPEAYLGDTPASSAALGAIAGLPLGAAAGGLSALFKNSKTFIINGNPKHWGNFQSYVSGIK
ncbi:MAG: hypothetical protein ACXWV5_07635, partial [Flavitalea sp.]